jgi:hypothetical protein
MFHAEFIGMFMIYLHTNFHTSNSIIHLLLASNLKVNTEIAPLLCYLKKKNLTKVACSLKIYYHIKFVDPTLNGASVTPTSELCIAAMLLL